MPKIDLTGREYRFFKVIKRNNERQGKNVWWDCQCQCGNIFTTTTTNINKEKVKSCGCMKSQLLSEAHLQDLTGQKFGDLKVIERDLNHPQNGLKERTYWLCECKCGNRVSIERAHLENRTKISCGCKYSIGEYNIHKILKENNIYYKSQYTNQNLKTEKNGFLKFDFAILNDANEIIRLIEFDGTQHNQKENTNYFGNFDDIQKRDALKNQYCKDNNIILVRIPYSKRDSMTIEDLMGNQFIF